MRLVSPISRETNRIECGPPQARPDAPLSPTCMYNPYAEANAAQPQ